MKKCIKYFEHCRYCIKTVNLLAVFTVFSFFAKSQTDNYLQGFKTNLKNLSFHSGNWTFADDGLHSNLTAQGDGFAFSATVGTNFVYETDVEFKNRNESAAALVFGCNGDTERKNMYVANINAGSGVARLFRFQYNSRETEALDLVDAKTIPLAGDNRYHLSVTVIGQHIVYTVNGVVAANTADHTVAGIHGQNDAFSANRLGLLTWNADCVYQNLYVAEIDEHTSPQLNALSLTAVNGTIEHNILYNPNQYTYIAHADGKTSQAKVVFAKPDGAVAELKKGDIICNDNIIPLNEGINHTTLTCTNKNAKVIYQLIIVRRRNDRYYSEPYRGQYHFSVKEGWANDPNGMVYYNGEYHLFHQFYYGINWGPMHWGHSTSRDLIRWNELPVAFYPDEYGTMFSGSAVVDENNTSGLFIDADGKRSETGGLVAIITAHGNGERVVAAYSKDGRNWQKYRNVLIDWTEDPLYHRDFRDPKVFRFQNKWFMVIAGGPLRIYSSDNLLDWQIESTYKDLHTECPDFYPLPVVNGKPDERKWLLSRGGRYYKIGDFRPVDGKWHFIPDAQYVGGGTENDGIMNFGRDAYAEQTYYAGSFDLPQRIIEINWMNFQAPKLGIENGNNLFNGSFTLQNELSLMRNADGKYLLQQTPIEEYRQLRDTKKRIQLKNRTLNNETSKLNFSGDSYEITAEFTLHDATEAGFNLRVGNGYHTRVGYNAAKNCYFIDRRKTGAAPDYYLERYEQTALLPAVDGKIKLRIFVDRNSVELYADDYTVTGAAFIYPPSGCNGVEIYSSGGDAAVSAEIYPMKSIWK
ncbi:MAG: glycoside hydrolase family 32 protein [Prevotellaceae bacterium]|jgi:sucrose-6-phosphate hydrolase SacC (GH32 family)|nr:glycoside hydrolase family 32 protein [Prevotellaceae bacterium]